MVVVSAAEFVERSRHAHVVGILPLDSILLIDSHHVLKVISLRAKVGALSDPSRVLLDERFLVLRNETSLRLVIEPARNFALETFRCVVRIALSIKVLRVDSADEACVAWDALVANLVGRPIHPRA